MINFSHYILLNFIGCALDRFKFEGLTLNTWRIFGIKVI